MDSSKKLVNHANPTKERRKCAADAEKNLLFQQKVLPRVRRDNSRSGARFIKCYELICSQESYEFRE